MARGNLRLRVRRPRSFTRASTAVTTSGPRRAPSPFSSAPTRNSNGKGSGHRGGSLASRSGASNARSAAGDRRDQRDRAHTVQRARNRRRKPRRARRAPRPFCRSMPAAPLKSARWSARPSDASESAATASSSATRIRGAFCRSEPGALAGGTSTNAAHRSYVVGNLERFPRTSPSKSRERRKVQDLDHARRA